jgi:hypothetical protein
VLYFKLAQQVLHFEIATSLCIVKGLMGVWKKSSYKHKGQYKHSDTFLNT